MRHFEFRCHFKYISFDEKVKSLSVVPFFVSIRLKMLFIVHHKNVNFTCYYFLPTFKR
jgi:hypothetical protein